MKLTKAKVQNFRLLHNVEMYFNETTTAIVGKNNSGKTSLTTIFYAFLNSQKFDFSDFSLGSHKSFTQAYELYKNQTQDNEEQTLKEIQKTIPKIQLYLTIKYDENDNWALIKPFLTSLDDSDEITVLCEYAPKSTLKFLEELSKLISEIDFNNKTLLQKISEYYQDYYEVSIRPYSESEECNNVNRAYFEKLVSAKFINAQRVLADGNSENNSKLSKVFHNQFDNRHEKDESTYNQLLNALSSANKNIEEQLLGFFEEFTGHFLQFGFPGLGNEKVTLKSQLKPENLFKDNVRLFYSLGDNQFSEQYNGLGYSNLIYIIAQVIDFYNQVLESKNINLIFIEEPEAHTHPQMQSVFVKAIGNFLKDINYQVILTTHSSHILAGSDPQSIRYFSKKENQTTVKPLALKDGFLKQYLTLGICDLFFADKAILVEGVVERMLFPILVEKLEKKYPDIKLSEQYITLIEVGGAYANKFKELLEILELKTLIITDIDSVEKTKSERNKTVYKKAKVTSSHKLTTSNTILKDWIPKKSSIQQLLSLDETFKIEGNFRVAYQKNIYPTRVKCGRSFEEAFIIDNFEYIFKNKNNLESIKNFLKSYKNNSEIKNNSYDIQEYIGKYDKKTDFAFDLLLNKGDWKVPTYIEEGLKWLAE